MTNAVDENFPDWLAPLLQLPEIAPATYMAKVPLAHRRHFGQFFTPPGIARWMAEWTLQPGTRSVLDPAVGTGQLVSALLTQPDAAGTSITGLDADPAILRVCERNLDASSVLLRCADFLAQPHDEKYDAIVCNPPYVRHRALKQREALYAQVEQRFGVKLSRFSNSYVLFILQIAALLTERGRAAIITPVDFLNANFGSPIKAFLLRENVLDGLLLFERSTLVFDDANVAACIVLLRRDRELGAPIRFIRVPSEHDLRPLEELPPAWQGRRPPDDLQPEAKWLSLFPHDITAPPFVPNRRTVSLGQLADVRRGIATGANEFFTLSEDEREQHGLGLAECRPCVTKANHAAHLMFSQPDFDNLRSSRKKVYLLDIGENPSEAARQYLEEGMRHGVDRRFLTMHRRPWYAAEQRRSAPLWVQTFSRRGFRFVLNAAGVSNLTAFHAIYPYVTDREYVLLLAALLNTAYVAATLGQHVRLYGGGLQKLEPSDVAAIELPNPVCVPDAHRRDIVSLYLRRCAAERTDVRKATAVAQEIDGLLAN